MDITSSVIDRYKERIVTYYEQPTHRKNSIAAAKHRKRVEDVSLQATKMMCDKDNLEKAREREGKVNDAKLKDELGKDFMNPHTVKGVSCTLGGHFFNLEGKSLTLRESVTSNFTSLKRVGEESVYGYALLGSTKDATGMFIAKTPRRGKGSDLEHELFVALNGTNKMREMGVPNFAMIYGGFSCPKAVIDKKTKKVVQWCSTSMSGAVPYIIYENISPGVTATEYISKNSLRQVVSLFTQLVFSVAKAHAAIGFTHFDAHTGNFIAREMPGRRLHQIPYKIGDNTYYVLADVIGTFIDYGMSIIKHEGEYVGVPDPMLEKYVMYTDRPHPLHDVYKFLLFTLKILTEKGRRDDVARLSVLISYFNETETVAQILSRQWDNRYSIPITQRTIEGFIAFMFEKVPTLFEGVCSRTPYKSQPLFKCNECWTMKRLFNTVVESSRELSLIQYYDLYSNVGKSGRDKIAKPLSESVISRHIDVIVDILDDPMPKYMTTRSRRHLSYDSLEQRKVTYFTYLSNFDKVLLYVKTLSWYATSVRDRDLSNLSVSYFSRVKALKDDLCSSLLLRMEEVRLANLSKEQKESFSIYDDVLVCSVDFRQHTKEGGTGEREEKGYKREWFVLGDYETLL